jgi:hypothetical protein
MRDPGSWLRAKQVGDLGFFSNIAEKLRYGTWQLKNTAFQFRSGNTLYNLKKTATLVTTANEIFSNIKLVLSGLERTDDKGLIRRITEKYTQDTLFDNDFTKLLNKTGIGWSIVSFDKSGSVSDFTGIDKGFIQKIEGIRKSLNFSLPSFETLFPHYECAFAGVGNTGSGGGGW